MQHESSSEMAPKQRSLPVLRILGTILLVLVLICGGVVTLVAYNFPKWAASLARVPLVAAIDASSLPADQKAVIKQNLNRIADSAKRREISWSQFNSILDGLRKGPLFDLVMVEAMRHQYNLAHPVADDARRDTLLLFDRFERGIIEKSIPRDRVSRVLTLVHDPDASHGQGASQGVSEQELRPFIDEMRSAVVQSNIPEEAYQPDFAAEIDKVVTAVLGPGPPGASRPAASLPATNQPTATSSAPAEGMLEAPDGRS